MTNLSGKRVLLTGDSHMEWSQFGSRLAAKLRDRGATPVNISVGGSSARAWASGRPVCRPGTSQCRTLADIQSQGPYDVAIVSLGTNDAANAHADGSDPRAAATQTAQRLGQFVQQLGARETWVVGPPRMGRTTGHYTDSSMAPVAEALQRSFGSHYIDSRRVPRVDGDGIHVGPQGGESWAQYVVERMETRATSVALPVVFMGGAIVALGGIYWFVEHRVPKRNRRRQR